VNDERVSAARKKYSTAQTDLLQVWGHRFGQGNLRLVDAIGVGRETDRIRKQVEHVMAEDVMGSCADVLRVKIVVGKLEPVVARSRKVVPKNSKEAFVALVYLVNVEIRQEMRLTLSEGSSQFQ
jgi:hypothetical protein